MNMRKALLGIAIISLFIISACVVLLSNNQGTKFIVGYWPNFETVPAFIDIPSQYNVVNSAFPDADPNCNISISNPSPTEIQNLRAQGKLVLLSIGGQTEIIPITSTANADNFVSSVINILNTQAYDGVDIDFEASTFSQPNITLPLLLYAIQQLLEHPSFQGKLFTMAPETVYVFNASLTGPELFYRSLILNQNTTYDFKSKISWIQMQYYNSGSMWSDASETTLVFQGTEAFITALSTRLIEEFGLRADQVLIGLPATPSAASPGAYTTIPIAEAAISTLLQTYPSLGGFMTWSIHHDETTGYAFSQAMNTLFNN